MTSSDRAGDSSVGADPPRSARRVGRPPELTIDRIVAVTRRQLGPGGDPDEVSLRAVAAELGVTAMALYRHVRDKDGLLELVADAELRALGVPADPVDGDWKGWLRAMSIGLFDLITASPVVAHVFATRPVATPAGLTRIERSLQVLTGCGMSRRHAFDTFVDLHILTVGFATVASARAAQGAARHATWNEFFAGLDEATYPMLVELAPDLAEFTSRDRYLGLLDARLEAGPSRPRPRSRGTR